MKNETKGNKESSPKSIVDPTKIHQIAEYKHNTALTTLRVSPTFNFVAAGAQDLEVQVWNLSDGKHNILKGHKSWVRSIDFSADGKTLFSSCWGGQVKIWDLTQGTPKELRTIDAHQGSVRWVRVSPDGNRIATCGNDLLVKVWSIIDGKLLNQFVGHERHVYGVDFHPSEEFVVSQDLLGVIHIWNLKTNKLERTIKAEMMTGYDKKFAADMGGARDLSFNADGSLWGVAGITKVSNAFAGIQDPLIVIFDWKSGEPKQQLRADDKFKGIAWGVRFHPKGFTIGAGADKSGKGELWFYTSEAPKAYHTFKMKSAARSLDLVNENQLAVAHADGFVRVYQMTEKEEQDAEEPKKE